MIAACSRADRSTPAASPSASTSYAGPQALALRVARTGGAPRVHLYPNVDSVIWSSTDPAPTPARMLAFDEDNGSVAYEDNRGRPVLLELRLGTITVTSTKKLSALASANGSAIYGITADGNILRMTPAGDWTYKPPQPAKAIYPQPDGALLIAVGTGANTRFLKIFPPDTRVLDSIPFPVASRTVRTQLGDRLYMAVDSGLVVLRTRTMDWAPPIHLDEPVTVMASTPSGDRVFLLTETRTQIAVVDRYRDRVTNKFDLPGRAEDLRIDPFGRYLLARAEKGDSIWVVAIGTQRVIGGVRGAWRPDLPFVAYDGSVAIAVGEDVVVIDGETLREKARVRGGAQDFWFPFLWDGFRPRAAALDEPVRFDSIRVDSTPPDTLGLGDSTVAAGDSSLTKGFIVSFAAFLAEDRAKELAARIKVGGENGRVITTNREGSTVYRVVLGPFISREEAERAGKESGLSYWVYEGIP